MLDETTDAAVDKHTTLVVYMGLATLPELTRRLTAAGAANLMVSSLNAILVAELTRRLTAAGAAKRMVSHSMPFSLLFVEVCVSFNRRHYIWPPCLF